MPIAFRVVDAEGANALRTATANRSHQIDPREITAGVMAGKYAFSDNVMRNSAFKEVHPLVEELCPDVVYLEPTECWPVEPMGD